MTEKEYKRVAKVHPYLTHLISEAERGNVELREKNLAKTKLPESYEISEAFITFFVDRKEKRLKKLSLKKDLMESIREVSEYCEIFSVVVIERTTDGKKKMFIFNRPQKGWYFRRMEEIFKWEKKNV